MDRDVVDDRVRPGEIDELEDTGGKDGPGGALTPVEVALDVDEDRLARGDVGDKLKAQGIQGHALGGDHVLVPVRRLALAVDHGADAMGVPEAKDAKAGDHGHRGIATPAAAMDALDGAKHVLLVDAQLALDLQLMGEDVEQDLRVGLGIDVPQVLGEEVMLQGLGIGQVAVMGEDDAIGRIDVEGLGLGGTGGPGGGIADVPQAHVAAQLDHVAGVEDVPGQPRVLAQVELVALAGDDARRVLTPVLEDQQGVVKGLVDRTLTDDTDDTAHEPPRGWGKEAPRAGAGEPRPGA